MRLKNLLHPDIWIAGTLLLCLSLPFALSNLDLNISALFYNHGWPIGDHWFWQSVYRWGPLPGIIVGLLGLAVLLGSRLWPVLKIQRRAACLLVLTLLIGPGILVNLVGKQHWGRPRPRDVVEFGGKDAFHRFTQPGVPGGNSFPSGHPSMGFLFTAFYFLGRKRSQQWLGLGAGLGYGFFLGFGRMVQGAHFASDVLWSCGLTYLTAAILYHVVLPPDPLLEPGQKTRSQT